MARGSETKSENACNDMPPLGNRIAVIGTTGAGKTTLARELARRLGYPHIELDALHWEPNWTEAPLEVFRARVDAALCGDGWVIDGNYGKVRDIIWSRADTVVWIDYTLPIILWRLIWRTCKRVITREELWGGNREDIRAIFGRDSIILWALKTYERRRREYPALLQCREYAHLRLIHLHSPREANKWLAEISRHFDPRPIS